MEREEEVVVVGRVVGFGIRWFVDGLRKDSFRRQRGGRGCVGSRSHLVGDLCLGWCCS